MKDQIVKPLLYVNVLLTLLGTSMKILHLGNARILLTLAFVTSLALIVNALMEVFSNKTISRAEKAMWLIAFLVLNFIAIVIYYFFRRQQLRKERKFLKF